MSPYHATRTFRALLGGLALFSIAGCALTDPYQRPGIWRPLGVNDLNFEIQVARLADLEKGRGSATVDGETAALPIERLRRDKARALPASGISSVGANASSGGGGGGGGGGAPGGSN